MGETALEILRIMMPYTIYESVLLVAIRAIEKMQEFEEKLSGRPHAYSEFKLYSAGRRVYRTTADMRPGCFYVNVSNFYLVSVALLS